MMRPSTFFFLVRRGVCNLGKHWAMTFVCILSLSVCMTLNTFASLAEVNVDSMVNYLGSQNETVVYLDPECDDATAQAVGEKLSAMPGVTNVQFVSKQDVLNTYRDYMEDYSSLWDEFENDNPFKANYRVSIADLSQMEAMSKKMQAIQGVYSVTAPVEMTNVFVQVQRSVTKVGRGIVLVLMVVSIITVGSAIRLSDRDHEVCGCHQQPCYPALLCGGSGHGPDLRCAHCSDQSGRLLLYGAGLRWSGRRMGNDHGSGSCAGERRLVHHHPVQPHRRCCCGWSGQHVLHPQTPECMMERSRT